MSVANFIVRTSVRCSRKEKFRIKVSGGSYFGTANLRPALWFWINFYLGLGFFTLSSVMFGFWVWTQGKSEIKYIQAVYDINHISGSTETTDTLKEELCKVVVTSGHIPRMCQLCAQVNLEVRRQCSCWIWCTFESFYWKKKKKKDWQIYNKLSGDIWGSGTMTILVIYNILLFFHQTKDNEYFTCGTKVDKSQVWQNV